MLFLNFLNALASICLTLSRVMLKIFPTSSKVLVLLSITPNLKYNTFLSLSVNEDSSIILTNSPLAAISSNGMDSLSSSKSISSVSSSSPMPVFNEDGLFMITSNMSVRIKWE